MSNLKKKEKFFYLLSIVYDGSDFFGWAIQPNKFTVQGFVQKKLSNAFKMKINVVSSSRTDKGVHALDQKIFFSLPFFLCVNKLLQLSNKVLSPYVFCSNVLLVSENFSFKKNILNKEYSYIINTGNYNHFERKYFMQYCSYIDCGRLNKILEIFLGYHDFFNFSFCKWKDKEKIISKREIIKFESFFCQTRKKVIIKIISKGFLRYQIRAMIGESMKCYNDKISIFELKKKLIFFDKTGIFKYKNLASPCGLYLSKINFDRF